VISEAGPEAPTARDDWQRFRDVTSMVDHWNRPGWSPGREAYYWYLTFDSLQLARLARRCQNDLKLSYLDPVPLNGLHLTLPKIGWSDEVTDDEVRRITETAREACSELQEFRLSVGPLSGSRGAVRFSVTPWRPLQSLSERLKNAVRAVRGTNCKESEFRPHIGIAYCNQVVPTDELMARITRLRSLPPVEVTVDRVNLVRLRRQDNTYVWSTISKLPLA
jgi:2'-5' RNA ligase